MFIRGKRAGIDVYIRVDFNGCDMKAAGLEERSHAAGDYTFTNAWYYTTSNQDVLHHGIQGLDTRQKGQTAISDQRTDGIPPTKPA